MHIIQKVFEVGFINLIIGCIKRVRYTFLYRKYGFDKWHIQPYELRKYAIETGRYISKYRPRLAMDIGCGLGDLLRHIKFSETGQGFGYDLDSGAIKAAKKLSRSNRLKFQVGSFGQVDFDETIDYVIALGFMHGSAEETWKPQFEKLIERNKIHHIVVDIFPEIKSEGWHSLDFSKILPPEFKRIEKMGVFKGGKYIEIWANKEMEK